MKTRIIKIISEWESFQSDGSDHPWNKDCPLKGRLNHFAGKMEALLTEQDQSKAVIGVTETLFAEKWIARLPKCFRSEFESDINILFPRQSDQSVDADRAIEPDETITKCLNCSNLKNWQACRDCDDNYNNFKPNQPDHLPDIEKIVTARSLSIDLGYQKWENFFNLIKKAISLTMGNSKYSFRQTTKPIVTGKGAIRNVIDYELNKNDVILIKSLTGISKPNGFHKIRSENIFIEYLERYYKAKNIPFIFQYPLGNYVFDCCINNNILFEYDEFHHAYKNQKNIDDDKDTMALGIGFNVIRTTINEDVIDAIIKINNLLSNQGKPVKIVGETINKVGEILSQSLTPEVQEASDEARGIMSDHFWELDSDVGETIEQSAVTSPQYYQTKPTDEPFLSPVESERKWQIEQIRKIWPNYPNQCPNWQTLNGLIHYALKAITDPKSTGCDPSEEGWDEVLNKDYFIKPTGRTAQKLPIKIVVEPSDYAEGYNDANQEWKEKINKVINEVSLRSKGTSIEDLREQLLKDQPHETSRKN